MIAAMSEGGVTLQNTNYSLMVGLDGEHTASVFEHKFRAGRALGKEPAGGLNDIAQAPKGSEVSQESDHNVAVSYVRFGWLSKLSNQGFAFSEGNRRCR
jgi:hypothetical protein